MKLAMSPDPSGLLWLIRLVTGRAYAFRYWRFSTYPEGQWIELIDAEIVGPLPGADEPVELDGPDIDLAAIVSIALSTQRADTC